MADDDEPRDEAMPNQTPPSTTIQFHLKSQEPLSRDEFRELYLRALQEAHHVPEVLAPQSPVVVRPAGTGETAAAAVAGAPGAWLGDTDRGAPAAAPGDVGGPGVGEAAPAAAAAANRGGAGGDANDANGAQPQPGPAAGFAAFFWGFARIAFASALLCGPGTFPHWFIGLAILKALTTVVTRVKFRLQRDGREARDIHPDNEFLSDDEDVQQLQDVVAGGPDGTPVVEAASAELRRRRAEFARRQARKRRFVNVRKGIKCATTFLVSAFPSWRVERLHAELIADGLMKDESHRRPPRKQQTRAPAAPADEAVEVSASEAAVSASPHPQRPVVDGGDAATPQAAAAEEIPPAALD